MAQMVDVGSKPNTRRIAVAEGFVRMRPETLRRIVQGEIEKGDVLTVARVAGVMAAKKTPELVPLCHPLPLTRVAVEIEPVEGGLRIEARVETTAKTGVEMEALTAVSVAALTVYDMAKALDPGMCVDGIRLLHKEGGKSGVWRAPVGGGLPPPTPPPLPGGPDGGPPGPPARPGAGAPGPE